jgi:hypothetical protein
MKSIFNKLTLIIVSVIMLSSCSKTEKLATETLEERISKDVSLRMAVDNAVSLYTTVSRTYINNPQMSEELEILATKINNKTATSNDYKRVEEIVGVPYDVFIGKLKDFALSLHELNKKYPELSKMKQASLQATLTKAIDLNPTLKNSLGNNLLINGRTEACPLRDICNLAVVLTKIFAGDAICLAINVTTIPVVGGLLCSLVINIGAGLLTAICNALPC